MMDVFDTIVVGAGIEGSATAYHLAKSSYKTLLLEQFLLPHTRGSSHGQSRIIRKAYDKAYYAEMMEEAFSMWHTLEAETSTTLFEKTGLLVIGRPPVGSKYVKDTEKALASQNTVFQSLNASQINKQFPMVKVEQGDVGVYESEAGFLRADKALGCYHKMFVHYGGTLRDGEPVVKVIPGDIVTVQTNKATYRARSIVITVGPWAKKFLKQLDLDLPLQPVRVNVCYWRQLKKTYDVEDGFPSIMAKGFGKKAFYGIPAVDYPMLAKICCREGQSLDSPDARDVNIQENELADVAVFIKDTLPYLEDKPSIVETCMKALTPDEDFVLDSHPQHKNIVFGAGFSGHGFKLAPVVGRVLSELASGRVVSRNLQPFSIGRFQEKIYKAKI